MIADFINEKMAAYIGGGMSPETATGFTRGELLAIYRRQHHSWNKSGVMRPTPPPENIPTPAAMQKCEMALNEILQKTIDNAKNKQANTETTQASENLVLQGSAAIKHTITAGVGIKFFFTNSKDNDPAAYTTDLTKIAAMWNEGQRRFKAFIRGRFLAVDIDRKPGKPDGLNTFYRIFPKETLPAELQD